MDEVFVYWDNSNIFHEAQQLADEEVPDARIDPPTGRCT